MSNYRIVTQAFPADYWADHGEEILDTANELHNERWSARESRSLLALGLRTRSLQATGGSQLQMWTQSAAFVLFITALGWEATILARLTGLTPHETVGANPGTAIIGAIAIGLLTRSTQWWAMAAMLVFQAAVFASDLWLRADVPALLLDITVISALAIWIVRSGENRPVMRARHAVLVGALHIIAVYFDIYLLGLAPILLLPLGLLFAMHEPRISAAVAVWCLLMLSVATRLASDVSGGPSNVILVGVPLVALVATAGLAVVGNRRLRQMI